MDPSKSYEEYERRFHLVEYLPKDVKGESVLLFGNSRSGKSTIYSGFLENKYRIEEINGVNCLVPESPLLKKLVSEQNKSCTELPNCQQVQICGKPYMLVDCPGSADNSPMRELLNFYYIQKIVKNSKSIGFLLIILMDEFKGSYFLKSEEKTMLQAFIQLFPNSQEQVTFVVNKLPQIHPAKSADRRKEVKVALQAGLKDDPALNYYFKSACNRIYIFEKPGFKQTKFTLPQDIYNVVLAMKFKQFQQQDLQAPNLFNGDNFQLKVAHSTQIELYMLSALKIQESIAISLLKTIEMTLNPQKQQKREGKLSWLIEKDFQPLGHVPPDSLSSCQKGWEKLVDTVKEHHVEKMNFKCDELIWPKNAENFRDGNILKLALELSQLENKFNKQISLSQNDLLNLPLKIQSLMSSFIKILYQFFSSNSMNDKLRNLQDLLRLAVFKYKEIYFLLQNFSRFLTVTEINEFKETQGKIESDKNKVYGFHGKLFTTPFDRIEEVIGSCMREIAGPAAMKIYDRFLKDEIKRVDDREYYYRIDRLYHLIIQGCKIDVFEDQSKIVSIYSERKIIMRAYQLLASRSLSISEVKEEALALCKALPDTKHTLKREIAKFTAQKLIETDKLEAAVQVFQLLEINTQVARGVLQMLSLKKNSLTNVEIDYFTKKAQRLSKLCRFQEAKVIYELLKEALSFNENYYSTAEQNYCESQSRAQQEQLFQARREVLKKREGQPFEKCFPEFTVSNFQAVLNSDKLKIKSKVNPEMDSPFSSGKKQPEIVLETPQKKKGVEPAKANLLVKTSNWRQS